MNKGSLPKLQNGVLQKFGKSNVRFFIFDPSEQDVMKAKLFVDNDSQMIFSEDMLNDQNAKLDEGADLPDDEVELQPLYEDCYELTNPFPKIFTAFKKKFSDGIAPTQYGEKILKLFR